MVSLCEDSHASQENIPASSKIDAPPQVQRAKQRRVLGVLSENEQQGRSSLSQLAFLGCSSASNYDVYVEEACEVVLAASGQEEISNGRYPDVDPAALQHEDLRLLLELSSSELAKIQGRLYTETFGSDFIIFYRCCSSL
ncbi:hypothetical protein EYF80_035702 [Liparis tanakae]|uniref:Uncharacterized protein n=1 Tax=Liparis tanakae TaxID=230148 RepID=A0A4Z2GLH8_9TELE|nr:hypothetical protein EYF80_035702 [Liparis tanakae]